MFKIIFNKNGFSLVEVLVALGIFAVLAAGIFNIVTSSYKNFYGKGDKQSLTQFAQEGIEAVRSIRDNSWQEIESVAGAGNKGLVKTDGYWRFSGTSNTLSALTRVVAIANAQRSSDSQIVTSGGTTDPNTKKVTVTVSSTGIDDYVLETYLTNWSYKTWIQTDWSGVGAREFWSNSAMASSSYSNIATSTGQITVTSTASVYEPTAYIYSSIYSIESDDRELRSVEVEQNVPAGCSLQITVEASNTTNMASASSQVFSDTSAGYYVSSTPTSLNGKKFLRYKLDLTSCSSQSEAPIFYSLSINYR